MGKYGMVIDISRCTGCYCCFVACKDEYWNNDYAPYSAGQPRFGQFWMNIGKKERGKYPNVKAAYMPVPCMQCNAAPCVEAANNEAVYHRQDGIVVIDPIKANGQKHLVDACPYGAIFWNDKKKIPQKCSFCVHRLEEGKPPRCVQACPSNAIVFGNLDDKNGSISKLLTSGQTEVFHPEYKTMPSVQYIELKRIITYFITGAVVFEDTDECAADIKVTLTGKTSVQSTKTNAFGNFEFDGLASGDYKIDFEIEGRKKKSLTITVETETILPEIMI